MSVHEKIKRIRKLKGYTQSEMAEKLHMSQNCYGNLERGKTDLKESRLEEICETLGISLMELISLDSKNIILNLAQTDVTNNISNGHCQDCHLKADLEKQKLLLTEKDKQIALLTELNDFLKNGFRHNAEEINNR